MRDPQIDADELADFRNEKPEVYGRCSSCGKQIDFFDGCPDCGTEDEVA
jgi:predicted amidophosphoribosyltransferase